MNQIEVKRRRIEILSYVIGIITIWLLGRQLEDIGVAYIAVSMECLAFLWILLGNNITAALGRMLRSKNTRGQYKSTDKIKKSVLAFQAVLGAAGSILLFVCARPLSETILRMPHCTLILQLLSPAILLRSVSAVLLGYFLGEGTELAKVLSCVLRHIFILGFGLLFCGLFKSYGEKISRLLLQEQLPYVYGGAGFAVAISLSEVFIIVLLVVLYKISGRTYRGRSAEGSKAMDSFGKTIRVLYGHMGMEIVSQLLGLFPLLAGIIFYQKSVTDTLPAVELYGGYFGKYLMLLGVAILPLWALFLSSATKAAGCVRREEQRFARNIFHAGVHSSVVYALFTAALITGLSGQFAGLFGNIGLTEAENMLSGGALLIVFAVLSFYFSNLLVLLGKRFIVLGALGLYNIVFILSAMLMLYNGKLGIMALVYSGLLACGCYALTTGFFVGRQLRYGLKMLLVLAVPVAASCLLGLLCLLLGRVLTPHLGNGVTIIVCAVLGAMVYWALLLLLRNFKEQELENIPGGRVIRSMGEMLRVF